MVPLAARRLLARPSKPRPATVDLGMKRRFPALPIGTQLSGCEGIDELRACNSGRTPEARQTATHASSLMPHAPRGTQHSVLGTLSVLLLSLILAFPSQAKPAIHWESWSDDVFARAKREHKFVLLDLEAVWCHWCHVMDEMTYSDERVIKLINRRYLAVRVDQDSRPDLSNRYEDYGWPATIVFAADRSEIVKRSGYIPPMPM